MKALGNELRRRTMKKKNTMAVLGIILVLAMVAILTALTYFSIKKDAEAPSQSASHGNSNEAESNSSMPAETGEEVSFEEIIFDAQPSMNGKTDYYSIERMKMLKEMRMDYLDLQPVTNIAGEPEQYYLGHQIYISQTNNEKYILSGETVLPISFTDDDNGYGFLRKEETGEKYHLFGNMYDVNAFLKSWEMGQKILSGDAGAEKGTIIFDGCLTDTHFVRKQGTIYFDLSEIAPLLSDYFFYDETLGFMDVYVNDCTFVRIPTSIANPMLSETMRIIGNNFKFKSWNGDAFECWGPVLDAAEPLISVDDANMMFGWKMYTNGTVLSIVSDPLNVTDLVATRESGDLGLRYVIETNDAGEKVVRAYSSYGELVFEEPFDETLATQFESESTVEPLPEEISSIPLKGTSISNSIAS